LLVDPAGRTIVMESTFGGSDMTAYLNGTTDLSFNATGFVRVGENVIGIAVEPDGSFLVARSGEPALGPVTLRHYLATGQIDTTFGHGSGVVAPALGSAVTPNMRFFGPLAVSGNGDVIVPGSDDNQHLVLAAVQTSDQNATAPIATGVTFTPPPVGGRWAYATVTFAPGSSPLDPETLAPGALSVEVRDAQGNYFRRISGSLVSSGTSGAVVSATYALRIDARGLGTSDSAVYQLVIQPGAITDAADQGSVGSIVGADVLHVRLGRHRRPTVSATPIDPAPI
jgi:hypothetical protein